jgi:hypothetical protein
LISTDVMRNPTPVFGGQPTSNFCSVPLTTKEKVMSIDPQATTSHPAARTTVIYTNSARFDVGHIVATPGALELLEQTGFSAVALLSRHIHGDWGDICEEDRGENEFAITRRLRLMSVYRLVDASRLALTPRDKRGALPTVWIITEADRSVTTLLLPGDY